MFLTGVDLFSRELIYVGGFIYLNPVFELIFYTNRIFQLDDDFPSRRAGGYPCRSKNSRKETL